jgi:CheY-like chemotaxis protein
MNSGGSVQILLVEDNPGDVRLTQEAFRHGRLANELLVCGDGDSALALLRERRAKNEQQPGLVLLDSICQVGEASTFWQRSRRTPSSVSSQS